MSRWTHVAGIIRIDSGASLVPVSSSVIKIYIKEAVQKALGRPYTFEDMMEDSEVYKSCTIPRGSEGSIQYRVCPNRGGEKEEAPSLSWGYISIWGDLRDFDEEQVPQIKTWFKESLKNLTRPFSEVAAQTRLSFEQMLSVFIIREAVLKVEVEYRDGVIFYLSSSEGAMEVLELITPRQE